MTELPMISSRSASKSTYQRPLPQPKEQPLAQKFQAVTKVTNYEGVSEQQIWKQYEKLRQCLKLLNESVLEEIEKRQVVMRRESPRKKTVNQSLSVVQEEIKTVQEAIKLSSIELTSTENKLSYLSKLNVREMDGEYDKLKKYLKGLKADIRAISTKNFMQSKNLTKGASAFQKLSQSTAQLQYLERKVFKQNNKLTQSQQILSTCLSKLAELQRTSQQRQDQYALFQQEKKQEDNIAHFNQLFTTKNNIENYESPWKKNYFLKLKELDSLVNNLKDGEGKMRETELAILKIKSSIDVADSKTIVMRKQLKREETGRSNQTMMEIRGEEQKIDDQKVSQDKGV